MNFQGKSAARETTVHHCSGARKRGAGVAAPQPRHAASCSVWFRRAMRCQRDVDVLASHLHSLQASRRLACERVFWTHFSLSGPSLPPCCVLLMSRTLNTQANEKHTSQRQFQEACSTHYPNIHTPGA